MPRELKCWIMGAVIILDYLGWPILIPESLKSERLSQQDQRDKTEGGGEI